MSKFINTQFSVSGIKDFDVNNQSYEKYDLVDYQYYTGNSIYPTDVSGLFAWFKSDDLNNFKDKPFLIDVSGNLESEKGVKDINKIDKFLNTVHNISS